MTSETPKLEALMHLKLRNDCFLRVSNTPCQHVANTESDREYCRIRTESTWLIPIQSTLAARLSARSSYIPQRSFAVYAAARKRTLF